VGIAAESCRRSRERDRANLDLEPYKVPNVEKVGFEVRVTAVVLSA
jgi:hypothetical protein